MRFKTKLAKPASLSAPPKSSVNVLFGTAVVGPGGRWVPCASITSEGWFLPCVYEVGPGRRQVCAITQFETCAQSALREAINLAEVAAA